MKLTRQLAPSLPPVQVVPEGRVPETWTVPVVHGLASPLVVNVTDPPVNEFPVPEGSIDDFTSSVEPSFPLELKMKTKINKLRI